MNMYEASRIAKLDFIESKLTGIST